MYCLHFPSYVQTNIQQIVRSCLFALCSLEILAIIFTIAGTKFRQNIYFILFLFLFRTNNGFGVSNEQPFRMRTIIVTWWKKVNKHRERNMNERRRIYRYIVPIYYSYWKVCSYVMVYLISVISNSSIPRYQEHSSYMCSEKQPTSMLLIIN